MGAQQARMFGQPRHPNLRQGEQHGSNPCRDQVRQNKKRQAVRRDLKQA